MYRAVSSLCRMTLDCCRACYFDPCCFDVVLFCRALVCRVLLRMRLSGGASRKVEENYEISIFVLFFFSFSNRGWRKNTAFQSARASYWGKTSVAFTVPQELLKQGVSLGRSVGLERHQIISLFPSGHPYPKVV